MAKTTNTFKVTTVTLYLKGGATLTAKVSRKRITLTPNVTTELEIGARYFRGFTKALQPYSYRGKAYLQAFITVNENGYAVEPKFTFTDTNKGHYGFTRVTYRGKELDNTAVITTTENEQLEPLYIRYTPIAVVVRYTRNGKEYALPLFISNAESYGDLYTLNEQPSYDYAFYATAELKAIAETAEQLYN